MDEKSKKEAFQLGQAVFIILVVMTIGEYWLGAIAVNWWAPIIAVALLKAYFVVRDYMHLPRLFAADEEE